MPLNSTASQPHSSSDSDSSPDSSSTEKIRDVQSAAGFRLHRFEVLNWGTFDQRVWTLDLAGEMALLTGANGSGKSTLVDGLLTLIVPNKKRNYNQASSASGKKERDERSYVQGAYGRMRSEESYGSKAKVLRDKGKPSVLLAYFTDAISQQKVTLAEVLWIEESAVKKFFLIAETELSIAQDFAQFSQISELKKRLKGSGADIFEEFTKYSQRFRKLFGLQSEKALDLFNQTVSIKEIGGLNEFVRNHMIERVNVQTKIQELQESYENLMVSHEAIEKARQQLEILVPLQVEAGKYSQVRRDLAVIEQLLAIAPAYFAQQKLDLLAAELQTLAQAWGQVQDQQVAIEQRLTELQQQERSLDIAIQQDQVGQRLQELNREIQQKHQDKRQRQQNAERYNQLTQALDLPSYLDRQQFYQSREQGEQLRLEIEQAIAGLESQLDDHKIDRNELQKQQSQLQAELTSLRQRKSQIPRENLETRDRLLAALKLDQADLPFVGELLQVRPEARAWEGAIERLLRGFGLCVLVTEQQYKAVNRYVHETQLNGRLVYYRVQPQPANPMQRSLDPNQVPHRLEIKEVEPFRGWLREQLTRQFNYVCCETLESFQHETRALTTAGLMKHGGDRHEKDDRSKIGDRRRYILGWNNAEKIKALEAELTDVNQQFQTLERLLQGLGQQRQQRQQQRSWLQDLMNISEFTDIDWRSVELEKMQLETQKQELEQSSDRLNQLQVQLKTIQQEIKATNQQRDELIRQSNTLDGRQKSAEAQQVKCQMKLEQVTPEALTAFSEQGSELLQQFVERSTKATMSEPTSVPTQGVVAKQRFSLDTIDQRETDFKDQLSKRQRQRSEKELGLKEALIKHMLKFSSSFPEIAGEMGTALEALDQYLALKKRIEQDDLPRHEKRFKELMTEKVITSISFFKSSLEKQEEEIRQNIDELNQSLQQINYTDSTYIQLQYDLSRSREIRDFKEDLKACLGDIARQTAEDNELRFQNIQSRLILRFKAEDRWTSFVTDVRNWLDFSVSERYRSDQAEKEHHTDSSGKSGGQKAKLAYTILASAIAYQFGLNQDSFKAKSFRFVVIDEAFSKSDDDNARYAMELFRNLNLQLLVVTPKDKINVIEGYLTYLNFVWNNSEGSYSQVQTISVTEYQKNRQKALSRVL